MFWKIGGVPDVCPILMNSIQNQILMGDFRLAICHSTPCSMTLQSEITHLSAQLAQKNATLEALTSQLCESSIALMFARQELAEATAKYDEAFDLYCTLRRGCGRMPVAPGTIF